MGMLLLGSKTVNCACVGDFLDGECNKLEEIKIELNSSCDIYHIKKTEHNGNSFQLTLNEEEFTALAELITDIINK